MDEQTKRVLSLFEGALQQSWLGRPELQAIRQGLEGKGPSSERGDWLRGQVMQVLRRKAKDEESRRLAAWAEDGVASAIVCDGVSTAAVVFAPEYGNEGDHQI